MLQLEVIACGRFYVSTWFWELKLLFWPICVWNFPHASEKQNLKNIYSCWNKLIRTTKQFRLVEVSFWRWEKYGCILVNIHAKFYWGMIKFWNSARRKIVDGIHWSQHVSEANKVLLCETKNSTKVYFVGE